MVIILSIDPDSNATDSSCTMDTVARHLRSSSHGTGKTNFDSGNKAFDNFFRTRLVSDELGQKLQDAVRFY